MIDCDKCKEMGSCCMKAGGVWVDLEEAKNILALDIKGTFHHLVKDDAWPSGWKVATSYKDKCEFLEPDGKCRIHNISFNMKPTYCKEFPYENGEISTVAGYYCYQLEEEDETDK